eukprot:767789-Hanusia_phi.AAC.3
MDHQVPGEQVEGQKPSPTRILGVQGVELQREVLRSFPPALSGGQHDPVDVDGVVEDANVVISHGRADGVTERGHAAVVDVVVAPCGGVPVVVPSSCREGVAGSILDRQVHVGPGLGVAT